MTQYEDEEWRKIMKELRQSAYPIPDKKTPSSRKQRMKSASESKSVSIFPVISTGGSKSTKTPVFSDDSRRSRSKLTDDELPRLPRKKFSPILAPIDALGQTKSIKKQQQQDQQQKQRDHKRYTKKLLPIALSLDLDPPSAAIQRQYIPPQRDKIEFKPWKYNSQDVNKQLLLDQLQYIS